MGPRRARARARRAAGLAAALVLLAACGRSGADHAAVGKAAPAFSTYDLGGRRVRLADYRGQTVLLNFWASWCIPCRTEFPRLAEVNGGDVQVLGVVFDDSAGAARAFMRDQRAAWPGLIDPRHQIADAYGVRHHPGIPVTYVIDKSGVIRAKHLGPVTDPRTLLSRT